MSIIEIMIEIDSEKRIVDVSYNGDHEQWFNSIDWSPYYNEKISNVFERNLENEIVEFHNRFFKCQIIETGLGKWLGLSSESVMKLLYEESLDKVSEGIQIFDRNGYFMHGNPASEKLERYKKEDFIGKHLLDLYNLTEDFSTTLSVLRTKKPVMNRCDRFKGKNNKEMISINCGYPLMIDGEIYGVAAFESDLSMIDNNRNRSFNLEAFIRDENPIIDNNLYSFNDIIHESESMKKNIKFAKKIALTNTNILITGDTGTGKELFAQSIHAYSPRRENPFIDVNCSAIPSNLIESIFFGTEKGAFTGSLNKKGFFEIAEGGTLFLDEINSIGLDMQAKLLRVLQEKRFQRVGGNKYIQCDIRIIAASNEDLLELIKQNLIRKDFYYRISTLSINIPTLKERKEDIRILAYHLLSQLCKQYGRSEMNMSQMIYNRFNQYEWPGNVRELHHVLEYAINHAEHDAVTLTYENLPNFIKSQNDVSHKSINTYEENIVLNEEYSSESLERQLEDYEKKILINILTQNSGNVTKAAQTLGLSRQSLQYRIKKYKMELKKRY